MEKEELVWYVAYGSNLNYKRFMCYLTGSDFPEYGVESTKPCKDTSAPRDVRTMKIPYEMYFGNRSGKWDNLGIAFIDVMKKDETIARAYLITKDQFDEIAKKEGSGLKWYGMKYRLEDIEGLPAYTLTCEGRNEEVNPCDRYVSVIGDGLVSCGLTQEEAIDYLSKKIKPENGSLIHKYFVLSDGTSIGRMFESGENTRFAELRGSIYMQLHKLKHFNLGQIINYYGLNRGADLMNYIFLTGEKAEIAKDNLKYARFIDEVLKQYCVEKGFENSEIKSYFDSKKSKKSPYDVICLFYNADEGVCKFSTIRIGDVGQIRKMLGSENVAPMRIQLRSKWFYCYTSDRIQNTLMVVDKYDADRPWSDAELSDINVLKYIVSL